MPRKSATVIEEPGAQLPPDPSPAEREEMATTALADTRTRLGALTARLDAIASALTALDDEVASARAASQEAHAYAASLPATVNAARARLLVVAHHASAASARTAVDEAEAAVAGARDAAAKASARAAAIEDDASTRRAALTSEHDALVAEQSDLASLVTHLEQQVRDARAAQGTALLEAARAQMAHLLAAAEAARAQLAAAEAAVAAHRVATAEQLAPYPAAHDQIAPPLAVPEEPTAAERILATFMAHLDALEAGFGRVETQAAGGVPLWAIITSGTGLPGVLAGLNPSYVPGKRAAARTWLDALHEGRA
jgi:hypothetical protein